MGANNAITTTATAKATLRGGVLKDKSTGGAEAISTGAKSLAPTDQSSAAAATGGRLARAQTASLPRPPEVVGGACSDWAHN